MGKLPAFQFYPGDWLKDPNLRRCTHAAKGVWIDLLCLMFESEERGVLATAGVAWSDDEVALAIGGDRAAVLACVQELTLKGVANRQSNGALYSKRLVRDEHKRKLCIEAGKRGGNPNLTKTLNRLSKSDDKGVSKRNPTPSSSSSISSSDILHEPKTKPSWSEHEGWTEVEQLREEFSEAFPACGFDLQLKKAGSWLKANPTKARKSNWRKFLHGWFTRTQDRGGDGTRRLIPISAQKQAASQKNNINESAFNEWAKQFPNPFTLAQADERQVEKYLAEVGQ